METRFKKSKALLWVMGGLFLGMVILAIFVHDWSLAVFMGILFVVALILHYLDKDNDLVIDDRGIHQVKGVNYKWYQINHCYLASRLEGSYGRYSGPYRSTYLIIVLNGGKRVSIDLASYDIRKKDIMGIIQEASGKDIGYRDSVDLSHENEVERKKRKSMWIWSIIGAIIFLYFFLVVQIVGQQISRFAKKMTGVEVHRRRLFPCIMAVQVASPIRPEKPQKFHLCFTRCLFGFS